MRRDNDKELVRSLLRWYRANARDLPWRDRPLGAARDPYRLLVSEIMLQQTQASRVAERFGEFMRRFPTVEHLARADEADVLALWSGLGYYRRARLLQAAARAVVEEHGGRFPGSAAALVGLPGVGRYTAGAIASLGFHERTPAVDGNVTRVILRLEGAPLSLSDPEAAALAWARAGALHGAAPRSAGSAALLTEALVELGAVVCTPRAARCGACPVAGECVARRRGLVGEIPRPKRVAEAKTIYLASVLIADARGRLAVTRRAVGAAGNGLWAGLHEAPTVERMDRAPRPGEIRRSLGLPSGRAVLRRVGSFPFQTSHRSCAFDVYAAAAPAEPPREWRFLDAAAIAGLGLSSPQRRILLEMGRSRVAER